MSEEKTCRVCHFEHTEHEIIGDDYYIHFCPVCQRMTYNDFNTNIRSEIHNGFEDLTFMTCRICKIVRNV